MAAKKKEQDYRVAAIAVSWLDADGDPVEYAYGDIIPADSLPADFPDLVASGSLVSPDDPDPTPDLSGVSAATITKFTAVERASRRSSTSTSSESE